MSRDDFEFDDDLFRDEGDDDELQDDEFGFGDDEDIDDFEDIGDFDDVDEDFLMDDEEAETGGRSNRTFIILAALMIFVFVIGLVVVLFLALRDPGPSEFDLQVTERVAFNQTQEALLFATQTQAVLDQEAAETQQALDQIATETAAVLELTTTAEAELAITQTAEAEFEQTAIVLTQTAEAPDPIAALQTEQAESLTQTAIAELEVEPPDVVEPPDIGDVALTSTALVEIFLTLTPVDVGDPTPTAEIIGGPFVTPPAVLPDTGLFDDITSGENMGLIMLLAFGLVGVIFGARRLRAMNDKRDNERRK
jgi:hypothetical protein